MKWRPKNTRADLEQSEKDLVLYALRDFYLSLIPCGRRAGSCHRLWTGLAAQHTTPSHPGSASEWQEWSHGSGQNRSCVIRIEHPPLDLRLFQHSATSLNSGLCSLWSVWNLLNWFSSEHITLALSETSIWEFWDTTGQQELSWLHRKETFIHVLHQALQGQQDSSVEGDVASLRYATGKRFLPEAVCWVCQALGQPPRMMGEWVKSHLSSVLLLAAGRR